MIEREDGRVTIYVGDGDVLMGATPAPGVLRVWFAPKPDDYPHPLNVVVRGNTAPPGDVAAFLFFVSREALEQFIGMMTMNILKAFPEPAKGEGGPC